MLEAIGAWIGRRLHRLRVAVVTPVGPGHAALYAECRASVEAAWRTGNGPFSALDFVAVDDGEGRLGRSRARNLGIARALQARADWLFFLDADDLMVAGAFDAMTPYVAAHDAVWGLILGLSPDAAKPHLRIPQIVGMDTFEDLLAFDPFLTLQMGHFVRAAVADAVRFDEALDAGEDFDYYLRLWAAYRCAKVAREFFINRHARHSTGPRAASAADWGRAVRGRLRTERERRGLDERAPALCARRNARTAELQSFCRQQDLVSGSDWVALSAQMPYRGEVEWFDCDGGPIVLHTENDDAICAQLAWTGESQPFAAALWQAAAGSGDVLDIGAGNGLYALLAARAAPQATVYCLEPCADNAARLRRNVARNEAPRVVIEALAAADANGEIALRAIRRGDLLPADAEYLPLPAGEAPRVRAVRVDDWLAERGAAVNLVRLCGGANVAQMLCGMPRLLARGVDLLLDLVSPAAAGGLQAQLQAAGYRCYRLDDAQRVMRPLAGDDAGEADGRLRVFASARPAAALAVLAAQAMGRVAGG
jgi:FkbM family methyltransferase